MLTISSNIATKSTFGEPIKVVLNSSLVNLLSNQLYQSSNKAIEELVVNAFDAEAEICHVLIPIIDKNYVLVIDNGIGMNYEGLTDLWHIANSKKSDGGLTSKFKRKYIGKFGIGKLAAKTIANKITYISKVVDESNILAVTVDFQEFEQSSNSNTDNIEGISTEVHQIQNWQNFIQESGLKTLLEEGKVPQEHLKDTIESSWTIVLLEGLTEKGQNIKLQQLKWVLSTAMPLKSDFKLYINGDLIESSKVKDDVIIDFDISEIPQKRIDNLNLKNNDNWEILSNEKKIKSNSFPTGISGSVIVTSTSLYGKSDDLMRSHGIFVKVHGRLINEDDALFGMKPLTYEIFNRLHIEINADDLNQDLKASRESTEETSRKEIFRDLLRDIANEALAKYESWLRDQSNKVAGGPIEGKHNPISARLVEFPVADILFENREYSKQGSEADNSWFYVDFSKTSNLDELAKELYSTSRKGYSYVQASLGRTNRLVRFSPQEREFLINQDHELSLEYLSNPTSRKLLEDIVTAEALLEVYLRQNHVSLNIIGRVLEQRDELLRSLAKDRTTSNEQISQSLIESKDDEKELEINLVVAARALGFIANHISGSGTPDGIGKFYDYDTGDEIKITLEAKSSGKTPSLSQLDFAGLKEHVSSYSCKGCLLIAPTYPAISEDVGAVSNRARELNISCWTVEQLAKVVKVAEERHIGAKQILNIVLNSFAPLEVEEAVNNLLKIPHPSFTKREYYQAILQKLKISEGKNLNSPRDPSFYLGALQFSTEYSEMFANYTKEGFQELLDEMSKSSSGGMILKDGKLTLLVSVDELERRLASFLGINEIESKRISTFIK